MWAWSPSSVTPKAQFRPGYPANEACCQTKWFIELSSSRRDSLRSADSCCPSRSTDTALKGSSSEACAFVKRKHEASDSVHYWIFADLRVCGTGATWCNSTCSEFGPVSPPVQIAFRTRVATWRPFARQPALCLPIHRVRDLECRSQNIKCKKNM